ncbi:glycine cleavage T C-terminal barrel domain-containing protein [Sulfitobacter aestuariivivens]
MQRMVSDKKDCIGKTMSERPGLMDPDRPQLVGLKPAGAVKQLTAGAHLYDAGAEAARANMQGYVTSVGFSPEHDSMLALGFVARGPDRMGEVIRMVDAVRGIEAEVEICSPVFVDPEGGRVRG